MNGILKMKEAKGFTLIELMIVVAIIGIIAAIGYPSYQESTAKARRADATGALMGLSSAMERMYTQNNNYLGLAAAGADDGAPAATVFPSEAPIDGTTKFYDLTMDAADDGQSYVLTATAKNGMLGDRCGNFTLSSAGTRATSTGDAGCWR